MLFMVDSVWLGVPTKRNEPRAAPTCTVFVGHKYHKDTRDDNTKLHDDFYGCILNQSNST